MIGQTIKKIWNCEHTSSYKMIVSNKQMQAKYFAIYKIFYNLN